jgi:DNA polymerase-4
MVGRRARGYGFIGRKVSLTVRYPDFDTFSKQTTLPDYTNHTHEIYKSAISILNSISLKDSVRLLGVCLSSLIRDCNQMLLFTDMRKERALFQAMDAVNDRYGDFKLIWGSYLEQREPPRVISPAWRPSGIKSVNVR